MSQSRENLQTDGRTDGQTLFHRILLAEARGPIRDPIQKQSATQNMIFENPPAYSPNHQARQHQVTLSSRTEIRNEHSEESYF